MAVLLTQFQISKQQTIIQNRCRIQRSGTDGNPFLNAIKQELIKVD
jgi:hypothetical protein